MDDWFEGTITQFLQTFVKNLRRSLLAGEISEEEAKERLKIIIDELSKTLTEIYGKRKAEIIMLEILSRIL